MEKIVYYFMSYRKHLRFSSIYNNMIMWLLNGFWKMKEDVRQALLWLAEDISRTPYKAAKLFKISQSTLTRVMVKQGAMVRCEACGYEHYDPSRVDVLPKKKNGRIDMKLVIGKK